jgi:hypothetical protein
MALLSGLRRAQIGGKRAPHKPLLLLWLFGRFAATGSGRATYAEAANPVSQLINDFGPPVKSPALERRRAAMPFVHLERDLWDLRDHHGREITADVPETARWLLDHGAVGQLRPEVTAVLADPATLAAAARLLLDQHFTPVLSEMICAAVGLDLPVLEAPQSAQARLEPAARIGVRRGGPPRVRLPACDVRVRWSARPQPSRHRSRARAMAQPGRPRQPVNAVARAPSVGPARADVGERERHQVDRASGGGFAAVLNQKPVQDVLAALGLDDRIVDWVRVVSGGLVPAAIAAADVPALHLDDRDANAGPRDDKVGLVLIGALDHGHRVQQCRIAGKLVTQDLPDSPFGGPARAEHGLGRIAARRHRRILPHEPDLGLAPTSRCGL